MSYAPDGDPLALESDSEAARISVYAQGRDYHDVVKKAPAENENDGAKSNKRQRN